MPSRLELAVLFGPLLNHVARRIRLHEGSGDLPPGSLAPEEIVDKVYLEAGAHLRCHPPGGRGYHWLRRIADRLLRSEIRGARTERLFDEEVLPGGLPATIARELPWLLPDPHAPIPEEIAAADEVQLALLQLLNQLPDELREPFLLVVTDGYSLEDAAAIEGLPCEEIRKPVAAATDRLRALLAEQYGGEAPPVEDLFRLVERLVPAAGGAARARRLPERPEAQSPVR